MQRGTLSYPSTIVRCYWDTSVILLLKRLAGRFEICSVDFVSSSKTHRRGFQLRVCFMFMYWYYTVTTREGPRDAVTAETLRLYTGPQRARVPLPATVCVCFMQSIVPTFFLVLPGPRRGPNLPACIQRTAPRLQASAARGSIQMSIICPGGGTGRPGEAVALAIAEAQPVPAVAVAVVIERKRGSAPVLVLGCSGAAGVRQLQVMDSGRSWSA